MPAYPAIHVLLLTLLSLFIVIPGDRSIETRNLSSGLVLRTNPGMTYERPWMAGTPAMAALLGSSGWFSVLDVLLEPDR